MGEGLDYYDVLGVARSADDVEIKKAFRRLALKHHPDADPSDEAGREFARICEAYDVLSSAKNKGIYDLYGEEVLKSTAQDGGSYVFDASAGPQAVFSRFFGTSNPYEALSSLAAHFEKLTTQVKPQPGQQQEVVLQVSLEELYAGCVKVHQHSRRLVGESGEVTVETLPLTVEVKPGQLDSSRFLFPGKGDAAPGVPPGVPPGPVVLVLAGSPHPVFTRQLSDLVARVQLPLLKALTGGTVSLKTLDGRVLSVPLEEIVTPGLSMRVAGEGMPLPSGGGKGDLVIEFELLFPTCLSQQQKMLLRAGLFLPAKPSQAQAKALREFEAAFRDTTHGWSTGVVKQGAGDS